MIRKHVVVTGRVQGVGYRYTARSEAVRRGVSGYARNRPDGAVELEVEGDERAVRAILDWLENGPPGAIVETIDASDAEPTGAPGFWIG